MTGKAIAAAAIEAVALLFAVFGQFLTKAAPPADGRPDFAMGLSSFLMLGILLFVVALARKRPSRRTQRRWLIAAAAMFALVAVGGFMYQDAYGRLTFQYPAGSAATTRWAGS